MSDWIKIKRGVSLCQGANCLACIHIGSTAVIIGTGAGGYGARLELLTDFHKLRVRRRIPA